MSAPLRIGLVGCGRLAELGYLPAIDRAPGVQLTAVADPDADRRTRLASATGAAAHPGAGDLIASDTVDAVVIASPAETHLAAAEAAAAAGLCALVEKPPAPDLAGARRLAALTPLPYVGFNRRFDPGIAPLRGRLRDGAELELVLHYRRRSWGAHSVADDALTDLGPHLVDLASWLTGAQPQRVRTHALSHERASLDIDLGTTRATISCATDRLQLERIRTTSPNGTSFLRGGVVRGVLGRVQRGPHPLVESLAAQLAAFASAVRDRRAEPALGTAADAVATMAAIDAARAGAADFGRWIEI